MKRRLKKSVVYFLYIISFAFIVGSVGLLVLSSNKKDDSNYKYVSKGILDYEENVPVVSTELKIVRPYIDSEVQIVKSFYDYKAESTDQEKALIYYEGTYMPSSGVAYKKGDSFDVVAIYDGKVKEIKEDNMLGNVLTIEHDNGIVSVYQSISDISVKEGDQVVSGQLLAKSSTSNISSDLENHLYFELIINGVCVNPENYYGKTLNELQG